MAFMDLPLDAPCKPNKGLEGGACNRQSCQAEPALWWNHGSHSWYCGDCARDIGGDVVNARNWPLDFARMFPGQALHPMFETREQMNARALPTESPAEIVEQVRAIETAWEEHAAAVDRMNCAVPDVMDATRAEREVYDERYRASEEAKRRLYSVAQSFAIWAAENQAASTIESLSLRVAGLEEALDACMSAFNGFENWRGQQGKPIPSDQIITLGQLSERVAFAQRAAILSLPDKEGGK